MNKSKRKVSRDTTAFLYVRLSRDDNMEGESYSISNQKQLLTKIAKEKGYTNLVTYMDDGVSGVTMNRPGFNEMIAALEKNKASAVFVKDMSRLGRNYIEVGKLTENFFPDNDIRLVAVSDSIDSDEGENELAPIRNLFNEWYARDISKKRRISNKIKGMAGEPMGPPPYGYIKDPDNPKRWIIDEVAADVVRLIFSLSMEGKGTEQISAILWEKRILTPYHYWQSIGISRPRRTKPLADPCFWNNSTVTNMLSKQEYCGDLINFKTYSKSYKNKTRHENPVENQLVFKDVHEPIIDRTTFEIIASKRGSMRKRKSIDGERNMFSGLLVCADCGKMLHHHFNQATPSITYFNCSNYKGNRGTCDTTHYIRVDFLEKVVLAEIRRLTQYALRHEDAFMEAVVGYSQEVLLKGKQVKEKEIANLRAREKELDTLFEKLYEDNVSGKLSDERFIKMSQKYEDEQREVVAKMSVLLKELKELTGSGGTISDFQSAVRKYTRVRKLTAGMLNVLVEKIEVFHAEKIDGVKTQRVVIHYHCVGALQVPDIISVPEITCETRKGVNVTYGGATVSL